MVNKILALVLSWLPKKTYSLKKRFYSEVVNSCNKYGLVVEITENRTGSCTYKVFIDTWNVLGGEKNKTLVLDLADVTKQTKEALDSYLDPYMLMINHHLQNLARE